jgi:two-component system, LytTR family, response regulator
LIKAIILDDEQPSVDKLAKLLNESGMVEIKGKFIEPLVALDFLQNNKIDAAFLDIEMPDMDGIEFSNRLIDLQGRIAVVFVTAYNQYAVEAFRLNALDFLMKPVTAERLKETLDRIIEEREIRMHPAKVQIQCFGKFKVTNGSAEVKFRTEKAKELLALLIDRRGNFVNRNEIIDCLWEEYDGDRALIHFNTTLHYLKKALLQQGVAVPIEHERGSYRFGADGPACDYYRFQAFMARHGTMNPTNIMEYEEVAGLYSGDYLVGMDFPWAERNRQMLKDQFVHLLLEIAGYHKTAGNHQITVEWLKQGLIHEPLHREMNYRLIEALIFSNNRISADRYFDIYKNELRRKLGQGPDVGFRKLLG